MNTLSQKEFYLNLFMEYQTKALRSNRFRDYISRLLEAADASDFNLSGIGAGVAAKSNNYIQNSPGRSLSFVVGSDAKKEFEEYIGRRLYVFMSAIHFDTVGRMQAFRPWTPTTEAFYFDVRLTDFSTDSDDKHLNIRNALAILTDRNADRLAFLDSFSAH